MKPSAAHRLPSRPGGLILAALCTAALLVVLGGCGEFNDDPNPGGLTVTYGFAPSASGVFTSGGVSSPQAIDSSPCTGCEAVHTVIVGAIVINHTRAGCSAPCAYTDAGQVTGVDDDRLGDDAEQSVQYIGLAQLPTASDTVEFAIPPQTAGPWQLVAVGLRNRRTSIDEIDFDLDAMWYGFIPRFLNDTVSAGQTVAETLVLRPACNATNPPTGGGLCP